MKIEVHGVNQNLPISNFTMEDSNYIFWVSQMDREPMLIKIDIDKIPILNEIL